MKLWGFDSTVDPNLVGRAAATHARRCCGIGCMQLCVAFLRHDPQAARIHCKPVCVASKGDVFARAYAHLPHPWGRGLPKQITIEAQVSVTDMANSSSCVVTSKHYIWVDNGGAATAVGV